MLPFESASTHAHRPAIFLMRFHIVIATLTAMVAFARAADTLEPAGPAAENHERTLIGAFSGLFGNDVQGRVIVERSGTPQIAVGIDLHGDEYRVFAIDAPGAEWSAIEDGKPMATRCELVVPKETAQAVLQVWKSMLAVMRTQLDTSDIDGAVYNLSLGSSAGLIIGRAIEDIPSSHTGQLISLTHAMHDACRWDRAKDKLRIPELAAGLQANLDTVR